MHIRTYTVTPDNLLRALDVDPPPTRAARGEDVRWVDVQDATPEALVEVCESLNMSEAALDAVTSPGQRALLAPYDDVLIARMQTIASLDQAHAKQLVILCFPRTIVTLHEGPQPALDQFAAEFSTEREFKNSTVSALLVSILDVQIERSIALALENRDRVVEMEEAVGDEDLDPKELNRDSAVLKRKGIRLATTIEDQYWCARAIEVSDSKLLDLSGLRPVIQNAIANADYGQRVIERHGRRLAEARQELQIRVHDQVDGRLQVLTTLSAIFLPLTLITGVYGMNFDRMPELRQPLGYPITLGAMGLIAAGMLVLFWRRRWF